MPPSPSRGLDAFLGVHGAGGMHVEEADLADDGGAYEIVARVYLRADFEAEARRSCSGRAGSLFSWISGATRGAFAEAVGAVDGDPGFSRVFSESNMKLAIDG